MLDGGLDPTYRAVLAGPHTPVFRVEVWDGLGNLLLDDLPFAGGSVTASLTNRVTRNLNLTLDEDWYPWEDDDLLAPYGNELRAYRGVEYGNGVQVMFPVFRGKIQSTDLASGGTVEIDAADRAQEAEDAEFLRPYNSGKGISLEQQFRELIADGVPNAEFGVSDDFWQSMPALTWEADRGGALDEVGKTGGAFWYALPDGRYVLRRVPWTVRGTPSVTLTDRDGGLILEALPRKTRENVFNSVTAVSERTDGSEPAYASAEDITPSSPTYVGGKFGRKHRMLRAQGALNQPAALGAALSYVRRSTALAQTWSWSQVPDAAMELGEVVGLEVRGRSGIIQAVASFQMPLAVGGQMTVSARSLIVGALDDD